LPHSQKEDTQDYTCVNSGYVSFVAWILLLHKKEKGEPCIEKYTNSTAIYRSTKVLQIVKYLEGTFNGNHNLFIGKGCNLYGPSRNTTRTYERNFVGLLMDRIENQKTVASHV
jgi:hypothetical protein